MAALYRNRCSIARRSFLKASLIPFAASVASSTGPTSAVEAADASSTPEIVDCNVHLFEWPFRRLKYDRTELLVAKLRRHRITMAWAGSFEAVLNKQLSAVNGRLAEECRSRGHGMLVPIGTVNPAWPDWQEDLRRCHEVHEMRGIRLYPAYHGYALDQTEFKRLVADAAMRDMLIQIAMRLEDERVHHSAIDIAPVDPAPLVGVLATVSAAKVQLINSAGPLIGNSLPALVRDTQITFDIAATEGNGGVGKLIDGTNPSYRGAIPVDRLVFGSHAPFFPCESALLKLFESPLSLDQVTRIMRSNATRLIG